ncbi:flagellar basal body-associated FliL family protein [Parendozoicomonas haliclonae]|uniref:Flagellar protein FliL n=1 Tax=Parendozoicomonas haliclonae TaxID=1960125 RepID=A0A1X7AN02_9GAMM|nr:flagellar basal body-associated FliL family protein [Parendozoicomonas haliclonae]SMA49674.1 flagellar basal body-associated protein FliL [Parendozoicomonas haliclonae]
MSEKAQKSSGGFVKSLIVVLAIASAVGAWYWHRREAPPTLEEPVFHTVASVIVNLEDRNPRHYLKVTPVIVYRDESFEKKVDLYLPEIRNYLINKLREETVVSLSDADSYERVRKDLLAGVKALMLANTEVDSVENLIFTEFVVQ